MKAFLCGEGKHELGGWYDGERWSNEPGVMHALLDRECPGRVDVVDALPWKRIRKLAVGARGDDGRIVQMLVDIVVRRGEATVLFVLRDLDDDAARDQSLRKAFAECRDLYPEVQIVGAGVKECIEAWVLASTGVRKTETMTKAKAQAQCSAEIGTTTAEFVTAIGADPTRTAPDAPSLKEWLSEAQKALTEAHA